MTVRSILSLLLASVILIQIVPTRSTADDLIKRPEQAQIEDPRLADIVTELKSMLRTLFDMVIRVEPVTHPIKFLKLVLNLWTVLQEYILQIHQQVESSKCHDRSCTSYGTTRT